MVAGALGGTQADYVRVPSADHNLLRIPDDVEDERASQEAPRAYEIFGRREATKVILLP